MTDNYCTSLILQRENDMCSKCGKVYSTAIQRAFDKFPGPLEPGKSFGICECPENDACRQKARTHGS